jgi:hypothetical protein
MGQIKWVFGSINWCFGYFHSVGHIISSGRVPVADDLRSMSKKEKFHGLLNFLYHHFLASIEENHE